MKKTEATQQKINRKRLQGVVVSDSMKDTVIVRVEHYVAHPKYGKYIRKQKRYAVHNPENKARVGDTVTIEFCRPISKTKRFRIITNDE